MLIRRWNERIVDDERTNALLRGQTRTVQVTTEDGPFHFSFDGKAISSAVAGMLPNADIKVSGPSLLLKDVAVGRKSLLPAIVTKRIKVDAGMRDIILMKRLAGIS